jgi:hypothetical protein
MLSRLFQRRQIWWPTWPMWMLLSMFVVGGGTAWWIKGESFLAVTNRTPAEILIVESWIGVEGVHAAKAEFDQGGYRFMVLTGCFTGKQWSARRWSQVEIAQIELERMKVPPDKVIITPALNPESQRTFATAAIARKTLLARGIAPESVTVFTLGAHARRSRLIHAKVFGSDTNVGVISWMPDVYAKEPWWKSSERAEDLLKETAGYLFELLLNSGRTSNRD